MSTNILSDFIDGITSFNITIPVWLQITAIIVVMVTLCISGYFMKDFFDIAYIRGGMSWFIFVAILNLSSLLVIFIYYNNKNTSYVGNQGKAGKKGKSGSRGKYVTCSDCANTIYLKKIKQSTVICELDSKTSDFNSITSNFNYFNNIISTGVSIAYDSFIKNIILEESVDVQIKADSTLSTSIANFRALMTPTSISYLLLKIINETVTKSSKDTYGTFRTTNINNVSGYISLGDSVYGGVEDFQLNSFVISGNVLHPSSYNKLVTFTSYDSNTQQRDTYTLWRPIGQQITEPGFKNVPETFQYNSLGDICRRGTEQPNVNEIATIREDCLEPISSSDLTLAFVYVGALSFVDDNTNLDYTQSNSYLIEHKVANTIEIFSVWRTPMNTFITNCNSQNDLVNNSLIYNILNEANDTQNQSSNEYGNVSDAAMANVTNTLQIIQIPKILVAIILCKYYDIELHKELVYYFNRYRNKVPEFGSTNTTTASLGDLIKKITEVKKTYDNYNAILFKKANVSLGDSTRPAYDSSKEKHIPKQLLNIYTNVNNKLLTISVEIENTNTLLDIINLIFDNGLETRIARDADGIAQGGSLLNEIQQTIIMLCKMIMPPAQASYTIKDECLGTFSIDHTREEVIRELVELKDIYDKLIDNYNDGSIKKTAALTKQMTNLEDLKKIKIGEVCSHISDYENKLEQMNLDEFTTSRLKSVLNIYIKFISNLKTIIGNM